MPREATNKIHDGNDTEQSSFSNQIGGKGVEGVGSEFAHMWTLNSDLVKNNPLKSKCVDFAGGPVVKNLPASAGSRGSIPGLGRSHSHRATNPGATQLKPTGPGVCALHKSRRHHEQPVHRNGEEPLPASAGEGPHAAVKTQHGQN